MRHLFAAPCVLASIGPAHSQESASFLTGAEVSKALAGHTLRGSDWAEYYEPGGTIKGNTRLFGVRIYSGSWTIQFDRVCYDFPELRFVFRHGCEPWVDLTVKLLLKWPNLYYSTTAFAPRYYPQAILDYVNTRGADKIIYGGYYPWGFELERIFDELDGLDLRDDVWPRFLHDNAARVLGLDS